MLIKELHKSNDLTFVKNSLLSLRDYYNNFENWFDKSVVPNIGETRFVYVALDEDKFAGALILKKTEEIKVCTLYVHPNYQFNHIGGDFLSIASQTLQTNKLPISLSDDVKKDFFNNTLFNFVLESESQNKYCNGKTEYFGYIRYHERNSILRILKRSKGKIVIDEISFLIDKSPDFDWMEYQKDLDEYFEGLNFVRKEMQGIWYKNSTPLDFSLSDNHG